MVRLSGARRMRRIRRQQRGQRRIQVRRTKLIVPPNDRYNFFYAQYVDGGGQYETPTSPQENSNYSLSQIKRFIRGINQTYILGCAHYALLTLFSGVITLIGVLINPYAAVIGLVPFLMGYYCIVKLQKMMINDMREHITETNKDLEERGVKCFWKLSENAGYLHLCVDYPRHFNQLGSWDQLEEFQQQPNVRTEVGKIDFNLESETGIEDASKQGEVCAICYEVIRGRDQGCQINCNHKFHRSCIWRWNSKQMTCPICRQPVTDYFEFDPKKKGFAVTDKKKKKQGKKQEQESTTKIINVCQKVPEEVHKEEIVIQQQESQNQEQMQIDQQS